MPWCPSRSSRLRPMATELPSDERGGAAPPLSSRSLSPQGAPKLPALLSGAGALLCVFPPSSAWRARSSCVLCSGPSPWQEERRCEGSSFDGIGEPSLVAGRSFWSSFGPHAASFEAKRMIHVDFEGRWMRFLQDQVLLM